MDVPSSLPTLPATLLNRILDRCRTCESDPLAVLATGSYAAGRAVPQSDLDLTTLLRREPATGYRTWFEDRPGRPLHVSAGFEPLSGWLQRYDEPHEWSFGFPTETAAVFLWATDEARAALPDPPTLRRPAAGPELEDFVEASSKVRRAVAHADMPAARLHAHDMATLAPRLLIPLNPARRVSDRRDAMDAVLALPIAPTHYRADMIASLGLEGVSDDRFIQSALRLPAEMLPFLRERCPGVDGQPWLAEYLRDGTLERHLLT